MVEGNICLIGDLGWTLNSFEFYEVDGSDFIGFGSQLDELVLFVLFALEGHVRLFSFSYGDQIILTADNHVCLDAGNWGFNIGVPFCNVLESGKIVPDFGQGSRNDQTEGKKNHFLFCRY